MRYKPDHTCIHDEACAGCSYELGEQMAKRLNKAPARYVWMVIGNDNPCDIRRYAFSHAEAVQQLAHARKRNYEDAGRGGKWTLFKLVQVDKKKAK